MVEDREKLTDKIEDTDSMITMLVQMTDREKRGTVDVL